MGVPILNNVEQLILKTPIYRKRIALRINEKQPGSLLA